MGAAGSSAVLAEFGRCSIRGLSQKEETFQGSTYRHRRQTECRGEYGLASVFWAVGSFRCRGGVRSFGRHGRVWAVLDLRKQEGTEEVKSAKVVGDGPHMTKL